MNNGAIYLGFQSATEDSFTCRIRRIETIKYSEVKSIDKKDVSTGVKIGIGAAVGAGALILITFLIYANCNCS